MKATKEEIISVLEECKLFFEEENPNDFTILSERMKELSDKVAALINENKEEK